YTDLIVQKEHEKNECRALCQMADRSHISGKVILLADRNYESCNNLARLEKQNWNYLIRFIVCTHVDKHHIHSHIVFNSTAIDCTRKFRNFWRSSFAVRRISDMLCLENGLPVIAEPKPSRGNYGAWLGEGKPPTVRGQLEQIIDTALGQGCRDFDGFLAAMKVAGVEIKRGKHLAFKIPNGKRFVRCNSLGAGYSETAIM
ncbi:relaxase/mobilization nuclease domain-containing protein, partial [Oscillibacter sp. CU971]|uniref:relaxase/mobilization nuclease domain-containing protein n=1 Tax=Oscillibacter sp. CU971 TaxID=2780102 RepID=UPI00195C2FCE